MIPKIDHTNAYNPVLPVETTTWEPKVEENFLTLEAEAEVVMVQITNYTRMVVLRLLKDNELLDASTSKMVMEHKNPDDLCCAVSDLCAIDQLNLKNFKVLCKHPKPKYLAQILFRLHQDNFISENIVNLVRRHSDAELLWLLLRLLDKAEIPLKQGFVGIAVRPEPELLLEYLYFIIQNNLSAEKYFKAAFSRVNLSYLLEFMQSLQNSGMLTETNIDLAFKHFILNAHGVHVIKLLSDGEILNNSSYQQVLKFDPIILLRSIVQCLSESSMLNQTTFSSLLETSINCFLEQEVFNLRRNNLLNERNFLGIVKRLNVEYVADALIMLQEHNLLLPELIELIIAHDSPVGFGWAVIDLHNRELLTDENRDLAFLHDRPREFVKGMLFLLDHGKLSIENLEIIMGHANPKKCAKVILELFSDYTFTEEEGEEVLESPESLLLLQAWRLLKKDHLLSTENKKAVGGHKDPIDMANGIIRLHSAKLLDEKNVQFISKSEKPDQLAQVVVIIAEVGFLEDLKWSWIEENHYKAIFKLKRLALLDRETLVWLGTYDNGERSYAVLRLGSYLNLENLQAIRNHPDPKMLAMAIATAKQNRDLMKYLVKHEEPYELVRGLLHLKSNGCSTELLEYLTNVKKHHYEVAQWLCALLQAGILLTEKNRDLIVKCCHKKGLLKKVNRLIKMGLFTENCFQIVAAHNKPVLYCMALKSLQRLKEQKDKIRLHLDKHPYPFALVETLLYLQESNIFTEKTVDQVLNHPDLKTLYEVLSDPNVQICEELISHPNIACYDETIKILINNLYCMFLKEAATHPNPEKLLKVVEELSVRNILTDLSFLFVYNHQDPSEAIELFP